MKRVILTYIVLSLSQLTIFGQNPKVKKLTTITQDYNYRQVKIDTNTTEYFPNGEIKTSTHPSTTIRIGKLMQVQSDTTVDSSKTLVHKRRYFSDSSITDAYLYLYKDSTIEVRVSNYDTTEILRSFYKHRKLKRINQISFNEQTSEWKIYYKRNRFREKFLLVKIFKNGHADSVIIDHNLRRKVWKEYSVNKFKNEWYLRSKTKLGRKQSITWNTFYHDYHDQYFTSLHITYFNEHFHRCLEEEFEIRNFHHKVLRKMKVYIYEYY